VTRWPKDPKARTDFEFPPKVAGTWRSLSRSQREQWLIAARNRHFKWLRRRGGWKDAEPGAVFEIDGASITDLDSLLCALGEAIHGPGGYFGLSLLALEDCLGGSFGVTLPFVLRITDADACRRHLDGKALAAWARERTAARDFLDEEGRLWLLEAEREGREGARTLLDDVMNLLRAHGVTVEER
jgi:hypothetical protein